jgi:hypothetical protein
MTPYRNKDHYRDLIRVFGGNSHYFNIAGAVYKHGGGGSYTGYAMRYGSVPSWRVHDGGYWWLRDSTYSEPNGDYSDQCYLVQYDWHPDNIRFNDAHCGYSTSNYVCTTSDY